MNILLMDMICKEVVEVVRNKCKQNLVVQVTVELWWGMWTMEPTAMPMLTQ
jgi:hypothetical protein